MCARRWWLILRDRTRRLIAVLALLPAIALGQPVSRDAYGATSYRDRYSSDEERPTLPPFPNETALIRVPVDHPIDFDFFVDSESLSVGTDGVIRYTVVARAKGGASNIAYEGLRCKERERRIYAVGRSDRTWSMARNPKWVPISDLPANLIQARLSDSYFCPARIMVRDAVEARKALVQGSGSR